MAAEQARTEFEEKLDILPLGEDVHARLERAEALIALFISAASGGQISRATIWRGHFSSEELELPLPSSAVVTNVLDAYRDPEEVALREELKRSDRNEY